MDSEGVGLYSSVAKYSLSSREAWAVICYPPHMPCDLDRREAAIESLGVSYILSMGEARLDFVVPGLRVLGKGHSSVVVATLTDNGLRALKIRRLDSKRKSLVAEAKLLEEGSKVGATPKVYGYTNDAILMDYLGPLTLKRLFTEALADREAMIDAILGALRAARALDTVGVTHLELHRPYSNLVYPDRNNLKATLIIDLESWSRGCGNVTRLASFFISRFGLQVDSIRHQLRSYEDSCSSSEYLSIEKAIINDIANKESLNFGR